ncbi:L-rhamnose mutarotase [Streptomyces sp. NPDC059883]|uniref:L-rhamnose mutarotase n=1 Tax=unclassified Streptomyces TaxID=2593676 RepID=UPI0036545DAF
MRRVCSPLKVREDRAAEYRERHAAVRPAMLRALTECGRRSTAGTTGGSGSAAAPNAFGEVVVDGTRVAQDGVLSFMYQRKPAGTTPSPLRVIDFRLPS